MAAFVSKKYSYKGAVVTHGVSAQTVGEMLESIEESGEVVTSKSFLDASRPEDSPTHAIFEWDDTVAAENWRLHEAKNIILNIQTEVIYEEDNVVEVEVVETSEEHPGEVIKSPAYINVNPKRFGTPAKFVQVETAMSNQEMRTQVLSNAIMELKTFKKKYLLLNELSKVFNAIDDLEATYGKEN